MKELELELFLDSHNIHILCLTEHWRKKHELIFGFTNYKLASAFCRERAIRGGALIFLHNSMKFKERTDIVSLSVESIIEITCIELEHLVVVCVYSPPSASYNEVEKVMEDVLCKISNTNKKIAVCGDFNVNLLLEKSSETKRMKSLFKCYNLKNVFLEATRITDTTATCIDNIFCNFLVNDKRIINKLSSDHRGQLVSFELTTEKRSRKVTFVPVTNNRLKTFSENVALKAGNLPSCEKPNDEYQNLLNATKYEYDLVFKPKTVDVDKTIKFNDWATAGLHKCRKKLYELYDERSYNTSEEFRDYVRNYSKTFRLACATAKALFIKNKVLASTNVAKTTWNIINKETGKSKSRNSDFHLEINGESIDTDKEVANCFEKFFADIPISTTRSLNASPAVAESILKENNMESGVSFKFEKIDETNILKVFKSIKMKNTADLDGFSIKIIKSIIGFIAPNLASVFNKCIDSGEFPDLLKHSKIVPIFKAGSSKDPSNFRPISVLPALSKIFEKIILNQLQTHFYLNNLMTNKQFGFTKGRSTTDAGIDLIKHIFEAWEESRDAIGIFCDLSKAFDCVHHDILLGKLRHYGVSGHALSLLESYLSNRIQQVDINGERSSGSAVRMGVPQGSILGPFLFLVYINDLPDVVKNVHKIVLFADDTSLLFKVNRQQSDYDEVNNAIDKIVKWFTANNLLLNEKKTKCVKFSLPNVRQVPTNIYVKNEKLELVPSTVFLGITVDKGLQWGPHISKLANRLSSAAYAVRKIRQLTDVDTARLVYFSYFHSLMSYGILLWGHAADFNDIFVLQKRAVRAIYKMRPRDSLREKFKEINILTLASQFIFENIMYVKKNISNFKKNSDLHSVNTRNKNKLAQTISRLHKVTNTFMGLCIRFYNKVPRDIQELPYNKFKNVIKQKLCKKAYYRVNDFIDDTEPWV